MKITGLTLFILLGIISFAQAQSWISTSGNSAGSGGYISFNDEVVCDSYDQKSPARCLPNQQQKQEIAKWKNAIQKAVNMLPREFFEKTGPISWEFFINRDEWATANAGSGVSVNLLPNYTNIPQWMTWEPFGKNGLTEVERVYVALHEIAHIYSFGDELGFIYAYHFEWEGEVFWAWDAKQKIPVLGSNLIISRVPGDAIEEKTTLYAQAMGGPIEDFAETFALYVMWPEYLKHNFYLHYLVIKKILGKEYEQEYPLPSSIKSRLAVR